MTSEAARRIPIRPVTHWKADDFVGGHPALDFLNTVDDELKTRALSRLRCGDDVVRWMQACQERFGDLRLLTPPGTRWGVPDERELQRLHALRESAWEVFRGLAYSRRIDPLHRETVEKAVRYGLRESHLQEAGAGLRWNLSDPAQPDAIRCLLALQIDALLRSQDIDRVRECGRCTWLFIDRGRGRGRRWCSMRACGNRAKVQAFRARR